jgi:CMP/dCMP kinase
MIVTIDGPAGAGKSSVSRRLALALGYRFLDTGALYRAVTLAALEAGIDIHHANDLVALTGKLQIEQFDSQTRLNGRDVSDAIRAPEVTASIAAVADCIPVRQLLTGLQREIASEGRIVTEGRDQGTEVFPDAPCKIYLTATPHERAIRRQCQLRKHGHELPFEQLLQEQQQRDQQDISRPLGALKRAADATLLESDGLSEDEVLERMLRIVRSCQSGASGPKSRSSCRS